MTGKAFDAAYEPNLDAVVAAGGQVMTVYLTGRYAVGPAWCIKVHAKGLGILGNYEEGAGELVTCGRAGGVSAGQRAAAAYIADGAPAGVGLAIVFSVDVNVQPYLFGQVGAAFTGIIAGLAGRFTAKVYGEGALIDYLVANHEVTKLDWLSASTSFPGYNAADPNVAMVQQIGSPVAGTDLDLITRPIDGVWWPNGEAPSGGGIAIQGVEMLDPTDPIVIKLLAQTATANSGLTVPEQQGDHNATINALTLLGQLVTRLSAVAASDASAAASIADVKVQLGHLAAGTAQVDPVALAQAIADHVKLAAA